MLSVMIRAVMRHSGQLGSGTIREAAEWAMLKMERLMRQQNAAVGEEGRPGPMWPRDTEQKQVSGACAHWHWRRHSRPDKAVEVGWALTQARASALCQLDGRAAPG